jgi:signal transduction histidine kinase
VVKRSALAARSGTCQTSPRIPTEPLRCPRPGRPARRTRPGRRSRRTGRRYTPSDLELARDLASRVAQALDNARLYAEARQAIASRDAMMAVVSHDLGSLLTVVTMSTSFALDAVAPDGPPRTSRTRCSTRRAGPGSAGACGRWTAARPRASCGARLQARPGARPSTVLRRQLAGSLVAEAVDALRPQAAARQLALALELPSGDRLAVDADRDRLLQVLGNLIGNAIKFTEPGGAITVRVEIRGREVWFLVADTGCGIAPDDLPHVFERFWKGRRSAQAGAGLGRASAPLDPGPGHVGRARSRGAAGRPGRGLPGEARAPGAPARGGGAPHRLNRRATSARCAARRRASAGRRARRRRTPDPPSDRR